jgi:hypothetical protein
MTANANERIEPAPCVKEAPNSYLHQLVVDAWSAFTTGNSKTAPDCAQNNAERDAALGLSATKIEDPNNPSPENWKFDTKGHLLSAGDRFSADYDAQGNLQKAMVNGETWERKGNDVTLSFKDRDGVTQTDVMHNVKKFDVTTSDGVNSNDRFMDANIDVLYGRSSEAGSVNAIWHSTGAQDIKK